MKIATIGTGWIVDKFLSAVKNTSGAACVAMYSRKVDTAQPLAKKYGIPAIYTDLEQMLSEGDIDFIYIASPNSLHYEHAYMSLLHGKHVICEKPFTSTIKEAESLISLAKEKQLMVFEAVTTLHLPNYHLLRENMEQLGAIKWVQCNYSQYSSRYDLLKNGETPNVFNPKFSGGALADINIYNMHFVIHLFGKPPRLSYTANKHENGIDTSGVLVMRYPGFIAECVGSKDSHGMNFLLLQGEKGYMLAEEGPNAFNRVKMKIGENETVLNAQSNPNLLAYELAVFKEIYDTSDFEQCYELLDHSYSVMQVFEKARKDAGILFDADLKKSGRRAALGDKH
ncbi:Gfo/Idh/MocA family oxidoreductase [Siminovitchia acidinfaciens]|uniref:Gfo/Idh/MocA family oxidoreductase n=1 Tax=Siminovitchia acidinfaciens TaxID=2321395 RepID=A0A429XZJ3_9BACI|nr:Gfo/Idh/MocA family oxidoreductase [Siminovitchia acidinfaciens]RST74241.1 Gfo/Idh/MocA family oxidoreductase [Siminovitchia acidinfaciens]